MALQLDLNSRQLFLAKKLAKGNKEFKDLDFEDQLLMYQAGVKLTDVVPEEQVADFEDKMALRGHLGASEFARAVARRTTQRLR